MPVRISDVVTWVGKTDWELRKFHGEEYSTHRGSSYNSYLLRAEKTVLMDTVWSPFSHEYVAALAAEVDMDSIDYVVVNHAEPDHSGALCEVMRRIPDVPIYCTANGVKSMRGMYHKDWNFHPVKTGDTLNIGKGLDLVFVEAPMLHWPDTMMSYLTGEAILFSNDAFGQHLASEGLYNDTVDTCELYQEAMKYYANILTPFSKLVTKKIQEFVGLNLPLKMICPSHGVIWRDNPMQIAEAYQKWALDYQEDQVVILYDTMWNATRRMAEFIAQGIKSAAPGLAVKCLNIGKSDKNDAITEVFKSKAVLVGSSTINRGFLSSVAAILEEMRGLAFKNKKAAAFGSYGWSGESVKQIEEALGGCGFEVIQPGLKMLWQPDADGERQCFEYGESIGSSLAG
ncbi:anaerobic nitric oxide reductase flavorubredoxin [Fundidesulfovibrio agrisoli]|uniref:anaerobic nitric oxide reductase flavorubredoxin n=1 Tax=Fundidesulfovibrio agrisoli TaxID=2922717 RepID=UPI001FAC95F2|nr:anaerobic nitric oxide reductase flavorubredoxin [Fundidesulfovibrio agrisoli]